MSKITGIIAFAAMIAFSMAVRENPSKSDPEPQTPGLAREEAPEAILGSGSGDGAIGSEADPVISITTQPTEMTNVTFGSVTGDLSVAAAVTGGGELSYRWYTNTTNANTEGASVSGATGAAFSIPTDLTVGGGPYYYYCAVGAEGAAPVHSKAARINVTTKLTLTVSNFSVSDDVKTYNGGNQGITICYSGEGINQTTAGTITLYYSGKDGTTYEESTSAPINAGTYDVKAGTNGGTVYASFGKASVGTLTIKGHML